MNVSNQMRQSQKLDRKPHRGIRVQSVFDVTIHTIRNRVHSSAKNVFCGKNKGHTSKVCRKKARSLLPIKHSSNVVLETTLVESSEDALFSIYRLLTSNIMPPITVFIVIAGHNLPIEIDTGASISLLNWETFQKTNCESNISLLPTKSKLEAYSGELCLQKVNRTLSLLLKVIKLKLHF